MGTSSATPQYQGPSIDPEVPFNIRLHLTQIYQKLGNHNQAFSLQQQQIAAIKTSTQTIVEGGGGGSTPVTPAPTGISVNNQSGVTSYTTALGDNNSLILFNDASPIAVTLATQSPPWSTYIANIGALGAGTITLTPFSGTINGSATLTILPTYFAIVAFDGTNWFAATLPIVPVNTPAVTHEWLNAYNASTGAFTQTQPAASDLSNGTTGTGAVVLANAPTFVTDITTPEVFGGSAVGSNLTLQGTSSGSPSGAYVVINPNGQNVGVGSASPNYPLSVNGTSGSGYNAATAELQANANACGLRLNNTDTGGKVWLLTSAGGSAGVGAGNFGIVDVTDSKIFFIFTAAGNLQLATGALVTPPVLFANLPASPIAGMWMIISDAAGTPAWHGAASGSGTASASTTYPVIYTGSSWIYA